MAARRPLVLISGRVKELPTTDYSAGGLRYVPAYLANGAATPIPLNADGSIPAFLADGTPSNIPTQA